MLRFIDLLSNREISIILWTVVFFGFLIIGSKGSFSKLLTVVKMLFLKHFIPFYIFFGLYFFLVIYFLNRLSVWEFPLYKDFVYWFITTGIVLFFSSNSLNTYKDFTKVILTAISVTIIFEFIIGFYNFSLGWELVLIPFVTFIALLSLVADLKKEDRASKRVAKFLNNLLWIIGIGIFIFSAYQLTISYNEFFTISNLKSFLLPPVFTIIFLPLIYITVIIMKYEGVFINLNRYKFLPDDRKKRIKYSILKYANINFSGIEEARKIILFNKRELQNEPDINTYMRRAIKDKIHNKSLHTTTYKNNA